MLKLSCKEVLKEVGSFFFYLEKIVFSRVLRVRLSRVLRVIQVFERVICLLFIKLTVMRKTDLRLV